MNGMVCKKCEIELRPKKNDVRVVEYFQTPPIPYKLWCADLWVCPKCGYEIVCGFGNKPFAEHFEQDFVKQLKSTVENNEIIHCFEK